MDQKLPYEQHLSEEWQNLPLPNEDLCWDDMKKRLEEDEEDRPFIFWWRGCGLWGLLAILLLSVGGWFYYQNKKEDNPIATVPVPANNSKTDEPRELKIEERDKMERNKIESEKIEPSLENETVADTNSTITTTKESVVVNESTNIEAEHKSSNDKKSENKSPIHLPKTKKTKQPVFDGSRKLKKERKQIASTGTAKVQQSFKTVATQPEPENRIITNDTSSQSKEPIQPEAIPQKDTVHSKEKLPLVDSSGNANKSNQAKKDSSKSSSYFFSAGLSLHQQIPTAGQGFTPYSSMGRKGSIADYIPAPYIRFTKKDKWFVQAEFRYGAPVYTKSILYAQQVQVDTFNNISLINSLTLKKTFYHQLPVSFNYYLKPGLTLGTGFVWNKFTGAIAEQQLVSRNRSTGVETVLSKGIVRDSTGQSFSASFFQVHFETQYQWKKWQMGARYNLGLQPFIKYSLPGQGEQRRNANSLQLFIRYQFWQSKIRGKS